MESISSIKSSKQFQGDFQQKSIRITIDSPDVQSIPQAQEKAHALQRQIDEGRDLKRDVLAASAIKKAATAAQAVTVGEVWPRYLLEGTPKRKDAFKPRYLVDLKAMAGAGGEEKKRGGWPDATGATLSTAGADTRPSE